MEASWPSYQVERSLLSSNIIVTFFSCELMENLLLTIKSIESNSNVLFKKNYRLSDNLTLITGCIFF